MTGRTHTRRRQPSPGRRLRCRSGLYCSGRRPEGSRLHGPALSGRDFRTRTSSNFSSNIVSGTGCTGFVEGLVRLQAQAAGDDLFLDLGGAAGARLDAAEPPELTIVPVSSGVMSLPVKADFHLVSASCGVRAARSGRRSRARGSSGRVAAPGPRRGPDDDAEPAAADIPAAGADVDRAHRGTAAIAPRDARCQRRQPGAAVLPRGAARRSGPRPESGRSLRQHEHVRRPMTTVTARPSSVLPP